MQCVRPLTLEIECQTRHVRFIALDSRVELQARFCAAERHAVLRSTATNQKAYETLGNALLKPGSARL
jgi:hypothetical protein